MNTIIDLKVQGVYLRLSALCINVHGNAWFQNNVEMAQHQPLHLHIDNRTHLIPISQGPEHIQWCKDQIFEDEHKNLVIAPPYLHRYPWYEYLSNDTINIEVQGLYSRLSTVCINVQGKAQFQNNVRIAQS